MGCVASFLGNWSSARMVKANNYHHYQNIVTFCPISVDEGVERVYMGQEKTYVFDDENENDEQSDDNIHGM